MSVLIHEADPQSRPVVITIFTHVVRPYVPTFQNLTKQNNFQVRIVIATGWTVGLAEWIIDDTHENLHCKFSYTFMPFSHFSQVYIAA